MKLVPTRRTDYAIRALLFLAEHDEEFLKADEIAEGMDIPRTFVPQVLQELQRAHLVRSRPSRHGGYALGRPAEQISVLDVVEALEGSLDESECALRGGPCRWDEVCALHWVWSAARTALADELRSATIAQVAADDLALAAGKKAVPRDSHRQQTTRNPAARIKPTSRTPRR